MQSLACKIIQILMCFEGSTLDRYSIRLEEWLFSNDSICLVDDESRGAQGINRWEIDYLVLEGRE